MMSIENAKLLHMKSHFDENGELLHKGTTSLFENLLAMKTIDVIYESIGMCGECACCDIPHPREPSTPCCTINFDVHGHWKTVEITGYCSDFKRKPDGNE